jgi:N-acetyl-anhydromuramyl-L-alanine amidase AmpD
MIDLVKALSPLDINTLIQHRLDDNQFYPEEYQKKQAYGHHTAGNSNPYRVVDFWNSNPERIGTSFIIGGKNNDPHAIEKWNDGDIIQVFSSKKWAYHLGLKQEVFTKAGVPYQPLDKYSIGIEICSWGQLVLKEGKYFNYVGGVVPADEVIVYSTPFRGFKFYHRYTDAQIESTIRLLKYLCEKFNIPKTYNADMWDITNKALAGTPGIWTHVSVRTDKFDWHPQQELIQGLQALAAS